MVPILNTLNLSAACLGNHDLDFGVAQFQYLAKTCNFPWLCANVLDPALGEGVSIANLQKTTIVESSNGIKIGIIGLVEREWLDTINSLPVGIQYENARETAMRLVPGLREQGAELIVVVSHMREPNDQKLAEELPEGFVDIILGGHDHHYAHEIRNGIHLIRSGCDFKQMSYLEARKKSNDDSVPGWHFDIVRRDVTSDVPEDPETKEKVEKVTSGLKAKLEKPIGFTSVPLDARFTTIRAKESNYANFITDLMRFYYGADCTLIGGGTMRGDALYPPGVLKIRDIVNCFPFEDPVVVIRLSGANILAALENGFSKIPALEGRFPHVSGIQVVYDPSLPAGARITECFMGAEPIDKDKKYTMATRGYMATGKDGYTALSPEMGAEWVVDDENGTMLSIILRQYFLSQRVVGRWKCGRTTRNFFKTFKNSLAEHGQLVQSEKARENEERSDDDQDSGSDDTEGEHEMTERQEKLVGRMGKKWARLAGVGGGKTYGEDVDWTSAIAPKLEGRIRTVGEAMPTGEEVLE
ncbi:5'-nucleotidase [Pyronema domesticum]|nr:5'-nucleotidase [Pyronema domesticum]